MSSILTLNADVAPDSDYPHVTRVIAGARTMLADRAVITATVDYSDGECMACVFQGSATAGYPGPVIIHIDEFGDGSGLVTTVSDPTRHGDTFNAEWVTRYYRDRFTVER